MNSTKTPGVNDLSLNASDDATFDSVEVVQGQLGETLISYHNLGHGVLGVVMEASFTAVCPWQHAVVWKCYILVKEDFRLYRTSIIQISTGKSQKTLATKGDFRGRTAQHVCM